MNEETKKEAFHHYERVAQDKAGVAERMTIIGSKAVRSFMPDQHRDFFEQIPMIFAGAADSSENLWASVLFGEPGFIKSPTETTLNIHSDFHRLDPIAEHISNNSDLGLLGIELETRRRNRVNVEVESSEPGKLIVRVKQSFGNCPKYIQLRQRESITYHSEPEKTAFDHFDGYLKELISQADTFFIASQFDDGSEERNRGIDVSHRGGLPGFINIENDSMLLIPDYAGNNFFNTIGNIMFNPKVGLLFLDFEAGGQIQLTGQAETIWASDESIPFDQVDRMIRFKLDHGFRISNILPFRWSLQEYSPFSISYKQSNLPV